MCGFDFAPSGKVLSAATQVAHDCLELRCDGAGSTTSVADDLDLPLDQERVHRRHLRAGHPDLPPKGSGVMCAESGGAYCDGRAPAWSASSMSTARARVCQANACAPAKCDDGVKNQGEGDVDCGGPCPAKCPTGKTCVAASPTASAAYARWPVRSIVHRRRAEPGRDDVDCGGAPVRPCDGRPGSAERRRTARRAAASARACACAGDHLMISEIRSRGPGAPATSSSSSTTPRRPRSPSTRCGRS
jgi:hypothetical protein